MKPTWHTTRKRWGVTLIELLVVISILMVLAVVALPMARPAMEKRRFREAARAINVFFGSARNQAIETRRHCGVLLKRTANKPNVVTVLQLVEIPPLYSGDESGATISLTLTGITNGYAKLTATIPDGKVSLNTIRCGDLIQVNHQGPWYTVAGDEGTEDAIDDEGYVRVVLGTDVTFRLKIHLLPGASLPWNTGVASPALPFSIARQPYDESTTTLRVRRTANASLTLPTDVAIDLGVSGTDRHVGRFCETNVTQTEPVIFIFSPTGSLERVVSAVTYSGPLERQFYVTDPIFLMVGKASQVGMPEELPLPTTVPTGWTPPEEARPNWLDPESLWVCLHPQSGLVSVGENAYIATPAQSATFKWDDRTTWVSKVDEARKYARQAQFNLGGR